MDPLVFLLGAGASVDAGLPTSVGMTKALLKEFAHAPGLSSYLPTLHFVIGGIQFGRGIRGTEATSEVNIEELFEAVDMLGRRRELAIAPFVGLWSTFIPKKRGFIQEHHDLHLLGKAFDAALNRDRSSDRRNFVRRLERHLRDLKPADEESYFRAASTAMLDSLRRLLIVRDPDRVAHFKPLLDIANRGPVTVATLNYDNCVELAARNSGVELTTRVTEWSQGRGFNAPTSGIFLLKLHGSLSWRSSEKQRSPDRPMPHDFVKEVAVDRRIQTEPPFTPAVVFGAGNKLTPRGPFLDLLSAFRHAISSSDRLIVVGYGFGDEHINEAISRWINGGSGRKITVIGSKKGQVSDNAYYGLLEQLGDGQREFLFVGAREGLKEVCRRNT